MSAAVYQSFCFPGAGAELQQQNHDLRSFLQSLPPEGVLVRVHAAGVCHTDLHLYHGYYRVGKGQDQVVRFAERPGFSYPIVPGHEIAGSVYALGEKAEVESGLELGDRVTVYPWIGCEQCCMCKAGDPHMCSSSTQQLGFNVDGGYSEYVRVLHYKYAIKVPDEISMEVAALLPCGALTVYSAIKLCEPVVKRVRRWDVPLFTAVIGLGGLGQWALKLLKCCIENLPMKVIGIDISDQKLQFVQQEGLVDETFLLNSSDDLTQQAKNLLTRLHGKKLHIILDLVNTDKTFTFGLKCLETAGMILPIGLYGGAGEVVLPFLVINAQCICGSHTGSPSELQELMALIVSHSISPPPITSYRLKEASKALHDLKTGNVLGRAILRVNIDKI